MVVSALALSVFRFRLVPHDVSSEVCGMRNAAALDTEDRTVAQAATEVAVIIAQQTAFTRWKTNSVYDHLLPNGG